ncbi:MAG: hypothetical protein JRJ44_01015 [Deltaproteobacteria bacterium]|nr:hypothetical protein [Deltaproteobacteria bacterium]
MIKIQNELYKRLVIVTILIIFGYKTADAVNNAERKIYTYTEKTTDLTDASNRFENSNTFLTPAMLNVITQEEKENLIKKIQAKNKAIMPKSIINSEQIAEYEDKQLVFALADGILRCFDLNSSEELWAFIPPDQLIRLYLLINQPTNYLTNSPYVIFENQTYKIILFGEGGKGKKYYALDITSWRRPVFLYDINEKHIAYAKEKQGESRGAADTCKIKTSQDTAEDIFLIPGGYDANNSRGRALFTVKVSDGILSGFNFNHSNYVKIDRSIINASCFDHDGDRISDIIYAGDSGGNLFAINDKNTDGNWQITKLFSAPIEDGFEKKIFYAPKASAASWGEYIFFGTGDMTEPYDTEVANRFYAIKNSRDEDCMEITEDDLVNLTDKLILSQNKIEILKQIENKKGWYIKLTEKGEKLAGSPILFAGSLYFTTYTPNPNFKSERYGKARLYTLNYKNGPTAAYSEEQARPLSEIIGEGMPSAPTIKILKNSSELHIKTGDKVITKQPANIPNLSVYFWRQID